MLLVDVAGLTRLCGQTARRAMLQVYFEKYIVNAGSESKGLGSIVTKQRAKIVVRVTAACVVCVLQTHSS